MAVRMKTYHRRDCEWIGGRMAHLRLKGAERTLCGVDTYNDEPILALRRPVLTEDQAARSHRCKRCLARVRSESATTLTVGELVERLLAVPQELEVGVWDEMGEVRSIEDVSVHTWNRRVASDMRRREAVQVAVLD